MKASKKTNDHGLQIVELSLETLTQDPRNARKHGKRNLAAIEASLRRFGLRRPVVVTSQGVIVAGNGTCRVARERLGWKTIAAVVWDGDPAEIRAFAVADNRTAELAEWDDEQLADAARAVDLSGLGFTEAELADMIRQATDEDWSPQDELPQAVQLEPAREYAVILCETEEDWERLKVALNLQPVRRGGYKRGSAFDAVGTERVVLAKRLFQLLGKDAQP